MQKKRTPLSIALLLALVAAPAQAQDKCKDAYESGYSAGKDIADLKREVKELRELVTQLMERLGEDPQLAERTPPESPPSKAPGRSTERATTGTIQGKLSLPSGGSAAYVYIENVRGRMARGRKAKISQSGKQFSPRWLVVQKGTTVAFPNQDNIYHNVFSSSPQATFDLGIYRAGDTPRSYTFTKPGVIDVFCNMHEKMSAQVLVVPNYLYTRVASDGSFTLKRVPVGKRKLVAWAPGAKLTSTWVNVSGGNNSASLELQMAPLGSHKNKHGQPYGSYP